jgi:hypothetical protein
MEREQEFEAMYRRWVGCGLIPLNKCQLLIVSLSSNSSMAPCPLF